MIALTRWKKRREIKRQCPHCGGGGFVSVARNDPWPASLDAPTPYTVACAHCNPVGVQ